MFAFPTDVLKSRLQMMDCKESRNRYINIRASVGVKFSADIIDEIGKKASYGLDG